MNFLLLNGSLSRTSHSAALLNSMQVKITQAGHSVYHHNFIEWPLPFYNPDLAKNGYGKQFQLFLDKLHAADGIAIATPLYHGSLTGVLKNALDYLPPSILKNKPIALANIGGSVRAGQSACEHLRTILRALSGQVIHMQVGCCSDDFTNRNGNISLSEQTIIDRTDNMTTELISVTGKFQQPVG
ncbi:MAG: NAD(P)H-dependent oxidoreductase [Rhizobiales bacterium]|nr:NAD(P)H-dependent oxidoreductase [Hyphomicrobiales bacterium]NRB14818.1 NAD(P)H-dependent oxidoreductase [Hyphomicrobiales bacterium]